jgi:hypothetical protein
VSATGYTADDRHYIVPPLSSRDSNLSDSDRLTSANDIPITGIEEAAERLDREAEEDFCEECRGHGTHNPECIALAQERSEVAGFVCVECGDRYFGPMDTDHVSTWHMGTCDICGEYRALTEPRDFRPSLNSRAKVEGCYQPEIEGCEGILTVAQRHLDAAQALMDLATEGAFPPARSAIGAGPVFAQDDSLRERMTQLTTEAIDAVAGPRNLDYGPPRDDMAATAEMMNGYLHKRGLIPADQFLQPFDVPVLLEMVKLSRLANQPGHHDSMVDVVGWMGVYQECAR